MLSLRTKQLSERARRYAEISRIPLRVSAVFCVKDPAACGAILNGRLLRPGDRFEDPVTKHVVQVCEVSYSSVTLDYEGTKFVRGVR